MMLGYLLGRAGIDVVVLEKHADFFRDFRGDTVHPSTLQVMDELGLIDGFLKLPHQRLQKMDGLFGGTPVRIADLSRLRTKYPFIAFMPQWDFLNFLREAGQRFASLKVMMNTEAVDLIRRGETIAGVRANTPDGIVDIEADLTIACDGRHSTVRERAGLEVEEIGAPMDVLWFRVGRKADESENLFARVEPGKMMITFDRGDYWQCAYVIAKGQYDAVKARGLQALLDDVVRMAPILKSGIADVKSFEDVKLLTVAINRLARWTRPGLLLIGDAAHAMSPVGGVGVNLAVQDAVATANLLADKMQPVGGRARCRAPSPRIPGEDDAANADDRAEQHHQRRLAGRRSAAESAPDRAPHHRAAVAPGHSGTPARAWRPARARAVEGCAGTVAQGLGRDNGALNRARRVACVQQLKRIEGALRANPPS
jgi:2-polyprenyl-6-methoxyphenol hydroxylase-like FAD-dependent oxidoreductase